MVIRKLRLLKSNSSGLVQMFYFEKDRNVKIHSNVKIIHDSWVKWVMWLIRDYRVYLYLDWTVTWSRLLEIIICIENKTLGGCIWDSDKISFEPVIKHRKSTTRVSAVGLGCRMYWLDLRVVVVNIWEILSKFLGLL